MKTYRDPKRLTRLTLHITEDHRIALKRLSEGFRWTQAEFLERCIEKALPEGLLQHFMFSWAITDKSRKLIGGNNETD